MNNLKAEELYPCRFCGEIPEILIDRIECSRCFHSVANHGAAAHVFSNIPHIKAWNIRNEHFNPFRKEEKITLEGKKTLKNLLIILFSISIVILTGCATPKIVYIPTPVKCPIPHIPKKPDYPIKYLTEEDKTDYAKVAKAYVVSLKMCVIDNEVLRKQLRGYKDEQI